MHALASVVELGKHRIAAADVAALRAAHSAYLSLALAKQLSAKQKRPPAADPDDLDDYPPAAGAGQPAQPQPRKATPAQPAGGGGDSGHAAGAGPQAPGAPGEEGAGGGQRKSKGKSKRKGGEGGGGGVEGGGGGAAPMGPAAAADEGGDAAAEAAGVAGRAQSVAGAAREWRERMRLVELAAALRAAGRDVLPLPADGNDPTATSSPRCSPGARLLSSSPCCRRSTCSRCGAATTRVAAVALCARSHP